MGKRYRINRQWLSITNSRNRLELTVSITAYGCIVSVAKCANITVLVIQSESLARGPKLLSMYTVEQRGFLVRKYWQTGSFKACQTAFRTEFGERCAPSKCCIQKLVKKLETRGSLSNACRLLSLGGPTEGQSVQKYTPHNPTTQKTPYAKRFKPSTSTLWEK